MNTEDSRIIVSRFFTALQRLKDRKVIRGRQTFTTRYGINRRNLSQLEHNTRSNIFQPAWLAYLATDYGVSPLWLLTGEGPFFSENAQYTGIDPDVPKPKRGRGRPRKEDRQ